MKRIVFIWLVFTLCFQNVSSQNDSTRIKLSRIILTYGNEWEKTKSVITNFKEINFYNYFNQYEYSWEYDYLTIGFTLQFKHHLNLETFISMSDNFNPNRYDIKIKYEKNNPGIFLSSFGTPLSIYGFNNYFQSIFPDFDHYQNFTYGTNYAQLHLYLAGISTGVSYKLPLPYAELSFCIGGGVAGIFPFEENFIHKERKGNLVILDNYKSEFDASFFLKPELKVYIPIFKMMSGTMGIFFNSTYFISSFSNTYTKTSYSWILNEGENTIINNKSQPYGLVNVNFGIGFSR